MAEDMKKKQEELQEEQLKEDQLNEVAGGAPFFGDSRSSIEEKMIL